MLNRIFALVVLSLSLVLSQASLVAAQEPEKSDKDAKAAETKPDAKPAPEPKEESSVTDHTIKIGGQTIAYKATASTTLIKDDKGDPTASIFTIAYTRSDVKDMSQRPSHLFTTAAPAPLPSGCTCAPSARAA